MCFCDLFTSNFCLLLFNFYQIFRILLGINARVLYVLLLLLFGMVFYLGASTSPIIFFVFSICIISFFFSVYLTKWVLAKDEGPSEMTEVLFCYLVIFIFMWVSLVWCFCCMWYWFFLCSWFRFFVKLFSFSLSELWTSFFGQSKH